MFYIPIRYIENMSEPKKILIVGDGGTGKTCAIERGLNNDFRKKYIPGKTVTTYNSGNTVIYDYPGQCKFNFGKLTANIGCIDSAVVMYDLTSSLSRRSVTKWTKLIEERFGNVPIKKIGTKCDRVVVMTSDYKISAKTKD